MPLKRLNFWKRLGLAVFIGLLLATLVAWFSPSTLRLNSYGDFPAFYSAAQIVYQGNFNQLYNQSLHQHIQSQLTLGQPVHEFLLFTYPPFYALALSPLAALSFEWAYYVHTFIMLLFLILALKNINVIFFSSAGSQFWLLLVGFISFPIFRALTGGQNAPLSLYLFSAAALALLNKQDCRAGFFLGLWFFKAQFAGLALILLLFSGRFRILIGAAFALIGLYMLGLPISSWDWPLVWLQNVAIPFAKADLLSNAVQSITIKAQIFRYGNAEGSWQLAEVFSRVGLLLTAGMLVRKYYRQDLRWVLALCAPVILLCAQHALYYDAGLLLLTGAWLFKTSTLPVVAALILLSWLEIVSAESLLQPTFLLLLALFTIVVLNTPRQKSAATI